MTITEGFSHNDSNGGQIRKCWWVLLGLLIFLLPAAASAAPLTYTLSGVGLSDGGTASGTFQYDAATNTYSNVNVVTTNGGARFGAAYNTVSNGFAPQPNAVLLVTGGGSQTGLPGLALFFSGLLTGAGGTFTVSGQESNCADAGCTAPTGTTRTITSGTATSSAPPPPVLKKWFLNGVTLSDGATASGSFLFDAATNTFSNVNVTTTNGSRPGITYSTVSGGIVADATEVLLNLSAAPNQTGLPGFAMFFSSPLTAAGGTSPLTGQEANCADAGCTAPTGISRTITGGVVTTDADLSITKTDGVASAVPGTSVTYTIVATNAGPIDAPGTNVSDVLPGAITGTWTCSGSGGGTCAPSGSGNINDTVNLPAGGSVTYTVTANISASATGSISNTATVSGPATGTDPNGANNAATDVDTLTPQANLGITKTDGVTSVISGGAVTYTIVATNAGPSNAPGSTVADALPAAIASANWTCAGAGGGTCAASGSGNINESVNLPAGGSVTFTVSATLSPNASGTLSNTATVTAPGGVSDPVPGNNSATDTDTIVPAATTTTVTSSVNPSVFGQLITFTATVTRGADTPTGSVGFFENANPIAGCQSVPLVGGQAICNTAGLGTGNHTITANFTGTGGFPSSSGSMTGNPQVVGKANTTTTITSDAPDPSAVGQSYTVTVAVAPVAPGAGTPTGTISVFDGVNSSCNIVLPATSCSLKGTSAGGRFLSAQYSGDGNFNSSVGTAQHDVNKAGTTTVITSITPNASVNGQQYVVSWTVSVNAPGAGTPSGTVTVDDGTGQSCTAAVTAGSCALTSTTPGAKQITARYSGDANFGASVSQPVLHTVITAGQGLDGDINRLNPNVPGNGDGLVDLQDLFWYDQFARGLHCPSDTLGEFQRLDGNDNGSVDGGDYTYIANVFLGIAPLLPAKGPSNRPANLCLGVPTEPGSVDLLRAPSTQDDAPRTISATVLPDGKRGSVAVAIDLTARGTERAMATTITWDPRLMTIDPTSGFNTNPDVINGDGGVQGQLIGVNARNAAKGDLGLMVDFTGGRGNTPITAGTHRILVLRFRLAGDTSADTKRIITFTQNIVPMQLVDAEGRKLTMVTSDTRLIQRQDEPLLIDRKKQ